MTIMVIDGQGGKMGKGLVEQLKKLCPEDEILAIGTNSIATAAMLKSGADAGATGENPACIKPSDNPPAPANKSIKLYEPAVALLCFIMNPYLNVISLIFKHTVCIKDVV